MHIEFFPDMRQSVLIQIFQSLRRRVLVINQNAVETQTAEFRRFRITIFLQSMLLQILCKGLQNVFHGMPVPFSPAVSLHVIPLQKQKSQTELRILLPGYVLIDEIRKLPVCITTGFLINIHCRKRAFRHIKKPVPDTYALGRIFKHKHFRLGIIRIHFAQDNFPFARIRPRTDAEAHTLASAAFTSQINLDLRIRQNSRHSAAVQNNLPVSKTLQCSHGALLFYGFPQAFCRDFGFMHQ